MSLSIDSGLSGDTGNHASQPDPSALELLNAESDLESMALTEYTYTDTSAYSDDSSEVASEYEKTDPSNTLDSLGELAHTYMHLDNQDNN